MTGLWERCQESRPRFLITPPDVLGEFRAEEPLRGVGGRAERGLGLHRSGAAHTARPPRGSRAARRRGALGEEILSGSRARRRLAGTGMFREASAGGLITVCLRSRFRAVFFM